jgi:hypothetical protein
MGKSGSGVTAGSAAETPKLVAKLSRTCQSVQPDLAPEGAWVTPKDVGDWSGCSGAYRGVCLSGCTLQSCTQRRCTCTVPP